MGSESVLPARERKRLGQFFTGLPLARLLAELADASSANAICDPMAGSGDLLVACIRAGARPKRLHGVEIDAAAYSAAQERAELGDASGIGTAIVHGDAFDPSTWTDFAVGYDLLITNPPYVRYQAMTPGDTEGPRADCVRDGLVATIAGLKHLEPGDKRALCTLAEAYSGHSDLLLPSWLLCTALLEIGGTLAMVVPESLLSRNYGAVAWYTLLKWFDLQFVVQDADSSWFDEAQVRTALLVATRRPPSKRPFDPQAGDGYMQVQLLHGAGDDESVVGKAHPREKAPEARFALDLRAARNERQSIHNETIRAEWVPASHLAEMTCAVARKSNWIAILEGTDCVELDARPPLPPSMRSALGPMAVDSIGKLVTLGDLGWQVGQGLRTGANDFFYMTLLASEDGSHLLRTSALLGNRQLRLPSGFMIPVLRRQSDLCHSRVVHTQDLPTRLLLLEHHVLPEDIEAIVAEFGVDARPALDHYDQLPDTLAEYVRDAANTTMPRSTTGKTIPDASAVATNVRRWSRARATTPPRFWYMLPTLQKRHRPSIALPRVQGLETRAYLTPDESLVVDANFSTLWPTVPSALNELALLALMNSSWVAACLELTASVMGGGALKIEATHLRRLLIPMPQGEQVARLTSLGKRLCRENASAARVRSVLAEIDSEVASYLSDNGDGLRVAESVKSLLDERRKRRSRA